MNPNALTIQRLLIVAMLALLTACSVTPRQAPQPPGDYEVSSASLPQVSKSSEASTKNHAGIEAGTQQSSRILTLASLEQGHHHPAIAALFRKAEQARQQRLWRKALKYLDQARQIQPRNAAVLYRQAWVNLRLGQAAQAEQLLLRAKVFAPRDNALKRRLDWLLAEALDAQGKADKARTARARALEYAD